MRKLTRRHALANQFVLRIFCTVLGSTDSTWIHHKFHDDLVDFRLIFISIERKMIYMTKRLSPEQKEHTLVIEKTPQKTLNLRKWEKKFTFLTHKLERACSMPRGSQFICAASSVVCNIMPVLVMLICNAQG